MKPKTLISLFAILTLALALGGALNASPVHAQNPGLPGGSVAQGTVLGTGFTYQGRLTDASGNPTAGPCDFQFSLWDNGLLGSQIGSTQTNTNVSLNNGNFSAALDFGTTAFQGEARYLQIAVRCPAGSGGYTTLSGRVELTAAPYALSLRPGANIQGSVAPGYVMKVENTYTGMFAGDGLQAMSANGNGVYGEATGSSGTNYGVYGKTNSATGHGVYGTSPSANPIYAGVTGVNTGGGAGSGVYGYSVGGYGVYGRSTGNKAIYADGDAHVEGNLSWKAKTSYISVSAAAFQPALDGYDYVNNGSYLWNVDGNSDGYLAAVQLPHGAIVTKLTFYWWDGSPSDGHCALYRIDLAGGEDIMANANTSGSAASSLTSVDTSIDLATVDNSSYAYYLWLNLPDNLVEGFGAVIEYTITGPY